MPSWGTQVACSVNWNRASLSGLKRIAITTERANVTSETTNAVVFRPPSPCRGINASTSAPSTGRNRIRDSISVSYEVEVHPEHDHGAAEHGHGIVAHIA